MSVYMKFQLANYVTLHKCIKYECVKYDLQKYAQKETGQKIYELSCRGICSNIAKHSNDSGVTKHIFMKYWQTKTLHYSHIPKLK